MSTLSQQPAHLAPPQPRTLSRLLHATHTLIGLCGDDETQLALACQLMGLCQRLEQIAAECPDAFEVVADGALRVRR